MIVNEGDELLMWCGYCGGRAVKAAIGWEHADAGERITNISPGDFVSGVAQPGRYAYRLV